MVSIKVFSREKLGLLIAAVIAVAAVADRLVITPIRGAVDQVDSETVAMEEAFSDRMRNVGQRSSILAEYKRYGFLPKEGMPDDEKVAAMLSEIENLTKKSGLSLADIKPQPIRNVDRHKEAVVLVNAQGSMGAVVRFLYYLRDSSLLLRTEKLHLSIKDADPSAIQVLIKVTRLLI